MSPGSSDDPSLSTAQLVTVVNEDKREAWMTVFVHGSFATTLGLISVFNVIKDKVRKTNYKKITKLMRSNPFFYQMQPLHKLGLQVIEPTFDPQLLSHKYAIYPITAAYEILNSIAHNEKERNYFYTYGWTGLVSQYRRRKESINLYNALVKEYTSLVARGITPKIRLIAHSHGGNLILNTAGVHELLQKGLEYSPTSERYPDSDHLHSLSTLHTLLGKKNKEGTAPKHAIEAIAPFVIDELIMLGTPIQPETLSFFLSPFFKKIYNIYSDDDIIQSMDWVSTRRYYSDKRITCAPVSESQPCITQIKITLNKPSAAALAKKENLTINMAPTPDEADDKSRALNTVKDAISGLWSRLFGPTKTRQAVDPLHKEFWFMGWKSQDRQILAQQHIQPYPYVVLLPYIQKLADKTPDEHDLDIYLKFGQDKVSLSSYVHDTTQKLKKLFLNRQVLAHLQERAERWRPENLTPSYEMELLHSYRQMLSN